MVEHRLDYSEYVPEGFGTGDLVIVADGVIEVIDFKSGRGVRVDAHRNSQLMLYALGALLEFDPLYDIHHVRMTIVQPRLNNLSSYEMEADELLHWAETEVRPKALLAYEGKGEASDLRALMRLWPNYVQLVTVEGTGIKSVEDLRGKRVGVGAANSGVEINARMILNAYGITYDDIKPDYLAYGEAIDNMKNGQCDAVFVTSGLPNATVMDLGVQYDMVIVPIDGEGRDKLVAEYPYYAKSVIPAGTYNNTEDVEGLFVYNIMLVRKDLSDAMVYDMLEGIFQNISTIKASHNAADKNIDITFGVDDIQLPLHPGAEAFWKDNGYID